MKYSDVTQMTIARYTVNMPWQAIKDWIKDHERDKMKLDLNPDFQRNYVWTEKQKTEYVEWIMRGGRSGKDIYFNCPGWMSNWKGPMVIVDGKQRINAVLEFLDNKVKAYGCYLNEFEDRKIMLRGSEMEFIIHVNNLERREDVLQWYIDMNTGGTIHTNEEIENVKKLLEKEKRDE